MKSLITPAVLLATAGYLGMEGLRLSFSGEAFASAGVVTASQTQQGQGVEREFSGSGGKKGEILGGSEMMEFDGDIFADVPEQTEIGDRAGQGQGSQSGEDSPGKRQG
ncbi:hypothetical protein [uncultured Microbulbifer sp.]|uniref:hypothetical protein n=1 Tax=uncultured Microbulbifer sp. TaxID=348147 RepID=UPI0026141466|nr:hypothetical protein [uncultured Microbulbifer sp.]